MGKMRDVKKCTKEPPNKYVVASEWIGHGTGRLIRRDCLSIRHPESWPSLWVKKYGSLEDYPWSDEEREAVACPQCKTIFNLNEIMEAQR